MYTFELPSGTELELREMTGAEEELLTNQRLIRSGEAINQVLRNCFVRLSETTAPDREPVTRTSGMMKAIAASEGHHRCQLHRDPPAPRLACRTFAQTTSIGSKAASKAAW